MLIEAAEMMSHKEFDPANGVINELLSTPWQTCAVLPLQNFDFSTVKLNRYSKKIQEIIKSRADNNKTEWEVSMFVVTEPKESEKDQPTVVVTVKGRNGQKEISYYKGYLMSFTQNNISISGINLPLLLYKGRDKYPSIIHNVMENLFDTEIRKLNLFQHDFRYLCSLVIPALNDLNLNDNYVICYKYHIPGRPRSEYILFEVRLKKLLGLWNSVRTQCDHATSNEDIELHTRFHAGLTEHFDTTFGISTRRAHLCEVFVAHMFSVNRKGKIMFTSPELMSVELRYLHKLCDITEEMSRTSDFQYLSKSYSTVFYNSYAV